MSKRMSVFAGNSQEGVKNQGVPFLLLLPPFFFFFISFSAMSGNKPSDRGAAPGAAVADGKHGSRRGLCLGGAAWGILQREATRRNVQAAVCIHINRCLLLAAQVVLKTRVNHL